jgi:D-alanyl-D-alanine carboxypeptidase (penicillin-binding protein 5/6)
MTIRPIAFIRIAPALVAAISVCVGLFYAVTVPRGLAGDEVSHYLTVEYVAHHWTMPILGHQGAPYEAQFGPVYYFLAAIVWHIGAIGGSTSAFYAVRMVGVLLFVPAVLLAYRLALALSPDCPGMALTAAAIVGLDPSLLGNFSTVQNDLLTMVLVMLAIYLFVRWSTQAPVAAREALFLGLLVGIAVITKSTASLLVVALPLAALLRRNRPTLLGAIAYAAGVLLSAGWWLGRNVALYHSLTPLPALHRAGYPFPPTHIGSPVALARLGYTLFAAYWAPTESFSNTYHLSLFVRLIAVALTALALLGLLRVAWTATQSHTQLNTSLPVATTYIVCFFVAIAAWLIETTLLIGEQARTTLPVFFVFAIVISYGIHALLSGLPFQKGLAITVIVAVSLLACNAVEIHQAHSASPHPPSHALRHEQRRPPASCTDPVKATAFTCAPHPG